MSVQNAVQFSKPRQVVHSQEPPFSVGPADRAAEVGVGRVHDGYGVPDREHQPIVARIPRVGGVVAHLPVHQLGDDVAECEGAGWMPRSRGRRHADDVLTELNGLAVRGRDL